MNKQTFDINNLRIASPCSASWEKMAGDERTRFCGQCSHHIYNISAMTGAEVRALMANATGRVCGRIYRRADGTVMTKDCPVGLSAYRKRAVSFAGAALTAILGMFSVSFAQADPKNKDQEKLSVRASSLNIKRTPVQDSKGILTGVVADPNGAVIPEVKIFLYHNSANIDDRRKKHKAVPLAETVSNDEGIYKFAGLASGTYKLEVKAAAGFARHIVTDIEIKENEQVIFNLNLRVAGKGVVVGIFFVAPMIDLAESGPSKTILTREMIERMPKRNLF